MNKLNLYTAVLLWLGFSVQSLAELNNENTLSLIERSFVPDKTPVKPIVRIEPKYPKQAAKKGQEGWVQMAFVIDKEGSITHLEVTDNIGNDSFKKNALQALKRWRYKPATINGNNVLTGNLNVALFISYGKCK